MLYLFLLLYSFSCINAQSDYSFNSKYRSFKEGSNYTLIRDAVPLCIAPSMAAQVLGFLDAGASVEVVERMDEMTTLHGFSTNWYRVVSRQESKQHEGFIWGGHIAFQTFYSVENPSVSYNLGVAAIQKVSRGTYEENAILLQLSCFKEGLLLDSLVFEAMGTLYTETKAKVWGNRGLYSIQDVIEINFSDGYCGGVSSGLTVFWDGIQLHYIKLLSNGYSSSEFSNQYFIYPHEKQGRRRRVVMRKEVGIFDANHNPVLQSSTDINYGWNGKELYQIK